MVRQAMVQGNTHTPIIPSPQHVVISRSPATLCLVQMVEPKYASQILQPTLMALHAVVNYMHLQ